MNLNLLCSFKKHFPQKRQSALATNIPLRHENSLALIMLLRKNKNPQVKSTPEDRVFLNRSSAAFEEWSPG